MQHVISHVKCVGEGRLLVRHPEQILVRDDDQGVDILCQLLNRLIRDPHPVLAFEVERLGYNADGQDTVLARRLCDHGSGARAGSAAHTCRDEHHVAFVQIVHDVCDRFLGSSPPDFGT